MRPRNALRRVSALLLTLVMLIGLMPQWSGEAQAASYMQPYLNKMVNWGFMRGDIQGNLRPDNNITRAEFVTIINRAFGYKKIGTTPFKDVKERDWYSDDVAIAYNVGYINGTSKSTFSPTKEITREEAAVILARNLMMQASVGESTSFTDSRKLSSWSRGLVDTAASYKLISGYPDGSFRPHNPITRGETAIMVVNAVGTPVSKAEGYQLGSVYGNVLITASGATLKNTTIAGNLYVTAGVDLGNVLLENVTVLGEIVLSGGGVSEGGDDSLVLRNVNGSKIIVDNLKNQQVSLRVEGDGAVDVTSVRTDTYIVDRTASGYGLKEIQMDGEDGRVLKLSGNVKKVVDYTPKSYIGVESGQVETITIDEKATGSTLHIAAGATVDQLNLDVGTTVTGDGDVANLTVNADGSTVSMLPDQIIIRPGVEANIDGEVMDTEAAAESSADPRMLAGYPQITDLAPTGATAKFAANKKGTIYWAVTSVTDGSVNAQDLINPPSYSSTILKKGSVSVTGSGQTATAKISGLTSDGAYYLSAVLVDAREDQSPVKAISFTTPDNTVPAFATGYPYLSRVTNVSAQVTAMAAKTCRLYYAVLPKGSKAPTGGDFKANAVTGNLGYGSLDVSKNTPYTFDVNNRPLEELQSYDLYLWLTDIEGGSSSAVKKLTFTTVDKTPPVFQTEPTINSVKETSVGLYANLNEAGTLYWVIVPQGTEYPKPLAGQSGKVDLTSDTAKLQVAAGMNALKSGKASMTAGKDGTFTISGLSKETAYDLYYVAQDKAGNYSASVKMITIHTLDPNAPTVTQEFTRYNADEKDHPLADTDIRLVFSEAVQDAETNTTLVSLYEAVTTASTDAEKNDARNRMANILRKEIVLYADTGSGLPQKVAEATGSADKKADWVIDYRYAEIKLEQGKTVVTFPTKDEKTQSALNLRSGATYYFEVQGIADTSETKNVMGVTKLDPFTTVFAQVNLSPGSNTETKIDTGSSGDQPELDLYWRMDPVSTDKVEDGIRWDMILWSDTTVEFNLYQRTGGSGAWTKVNQKGSITITIDSNTKRSGASMQMDAKEPDATTPTFQPLKEVKEGTVYEYAVHFIKVNGDGDRKTWNGTVQMDVNAIAGSNDSLGRMGVGGWEGSWNNLVGKELTNIGVPSTLTLYKPFRDQTAPHFINNRPTFTPGDSVVRMDLMLDRVGTIYWVVSKRGDVSTIGTDGKTDYSPSGTERGAYEKLPESGQNDGIDNNGTDKFIAPVSTPSYNTIVDPRKYMVSSDVEYGSLTCGASVQSVTVENLIPNQDYVVYFVIKGTSQIYSPVYCYRFTTGDVIKPYITMQELSPNVGFTTSEDSDLNYVLFAYNQLPTIFKNKFKTYVPADKLEEFKKVVGDDEADDMTVLDAIMKSGRDGYSIFDAFAKPTDQTGNTIRDQVAEIIVRGQGSGGQPSATGSQTTKADQEFRKDFTSNMDPVSGTNYYCIATAQNVLGGECSFKAVSNVHIPDNTPPVLQDPGGNGKKQNNGTYTGTLELTFDEILYWIPPSGDTKEICYVANRTAADADQPPDADKGKPGMKVLINHMGGGGVSKLTPVPSSTPSSTFTFNYSNVDVGDRLILFRDGYIADANGNSTKKMITLEYQEIKTGLNGALAGGWVIISR